MHSLRYRDQLQPHPFITSLWPDLVQFANSSSNFPIALKGEFYQPEIWNSEQVFWMASSGQILIPCSQPEALVKLSFNLVPAKRPKIEPLALQLKQGEILLSEQICADPCSIDSFITLAQGLNPISCRALGKVLSPAELGLAQDGRALSFAFSGFTTTLLA